MFILGFVFCVRVYVIYIILFIYLYLKVYIIWSVILMILVWMERFVYKFIYVNEIVVVLGFGGWRLWVFEVGYVYLDLVLFRTGIFSVVGFGY